MQRPRDDLNASESPQSNANPPAPIPPPKVPMSIDDVVPEVDQRLEQQESDQTQPRYSEGQIQNTPQPEELDNLLQEIKEAE